MAKFKKDDIVICIYNGVLNASGNKPTLVDRKEYTVKESLVTENGEEHLDVGIAREFDVITDYKSAKRLPAGPGWCHASRFELKQ